MARKLKRHLPFHEKRAAELRAVREALGLNQGAFMNLLNERLGSSKIDDIAKYRYYETVASAIPPPVWEVFETIKTTHTQQIQAQSVPQNIDPRRTDKLFPISLFPNPTPEQGLIKRLNDLSGSYLCYYDLNDPAEEQPIIGLRNYMINGYDERDGSLVGQFLATYGSSQLASGLAKFMIVPDRPNTFCLVEYDRQRDAPPVMGTLRCEFTNSNTVYFYGILMGVRGRGEERIVAAKCLILQQDSMIGLSDQEIKNRTNDDGTFNDVVTEANLGQDRWKLLRCYLNGFDRSDGSQCLHSWVLFSYLGTDKKIREEIYLGDIVADFYSNKDRKNRPPSDAVRYQELCKKISGTV